MLRQRSLLILIFAMVVAGGAWLLSLFPGSLGGKSELWGRDLLLHYGRHSPANPHLIFLAIDNDSMSLDPQGDLQTLFGLGENAPERRALNLMGAHWPWPRSVYAQVIERLVGAGARVVVFDLNFPTPSDDDPAFRAALDRYRDHVVIGSNFVIADRAGQPTPSLTRPSTSLIPDSDQDSRVGFVNFWPDQDGVIRSAGFHVTLAQLVPFGKPLGTPHTSLAAQAVIKSGQPAAVPKDFQLHPFRLTAGPSEGFPAHSIFEIFVPEYWRRNYQSGAVFKDAIVVVGAAGNWQHDEHRTAFGVMPGPELQLNAINALLNGQLVRLAPWPLGLLIWLGSAFAAALIAIRSTTPIWRLLIGLGAALGVIGLAFLLGNSARVFIPFVGPVAVLVAIILCSVVYDFVRSIAEQVRLRRTLQERKREQEMLQAANDELERRVAERTAALREANETLSALVQEKDVLLKEIHHRVKNNLQIISSLLNLQAGYIKDPAALQVFTESRYRVRSMALIHEKLYQSSDVAKIDFGDYIRALTAGLHSTFAMRNTPVHISVEIEATQLSLDAALPCGLIINELVTNCFKYAFTPGTPGEIRITLEPVEEQRLRLRVADNGRGFPKDVDFRNTESLGMQIVTILSEQIEGTIEILPVPGTTFELIFPAENAAAHV